MVYNKFKKNNTIKTSINKYKTTRDKQLKLKASITFLIRCRNAGIIPTFILNSTKNIYNIFETTICTKSTTRQTLTKYIQNFHNKVLNLLLKHKHELLKHNEKDKENIKISIDKQLTEEEATVLWNSEHILTNTMNEKLKMKHRNKFEKLKEEQKKELEIKFNKNWFRNLTNTEIPDDVQWIFSLGNKHALPVTKAEFPMLKFITDAEDFIQTIQEKEGQEIARTRFTSIVDNHLNKLKINNRDKFTLYAMKKAKRFLMTNDNILILNADKGNVTVAVEKSEYDKRMQHIVGDMMTYQRVNKDPTNGLQKKNNDLIEELFSKNLINERERRRLKTEVATAPRIYGLPKIHKEDYPLRPICSSINTPASELCKYITVILKMITENSKFNVKDSVQFRNRIKDLTIGDDERLISFDVVSLFPSIPVDLALVTIEEKWEKISKHTKMEKDLFLRIVKFCIKDNRYFKYNGKIYTQKNGLPMGSPASPIVADIVMEKLLETVMDGLTIKPKILTKYVDDIFGIVRKSAIEEILTKLNKFHHRIKFTVEEEYNFKLPYLDTIVIRDGNILKLDWFQKPTSSGRIINFFSKHPKRVIINTANNLIKRVLSLSDVEFHGKNKTKIRNILLNNNFPIKLADKLIKNYDRKIEISCKVTVEPKIYKSLTYVPDISERFEKSKLFNGDNFTMAHKTDNNLSRIFSKTKDRIEMMDKSNVIYQIPCSGSLIDKCDMVYVGTTKNKLRTRIAGHKSDQKLKLNNATQKTALVKHCLENKHTPNFNAVRVLQTELNYKRRYMLEMLNIIKTKTTQRINFKSDIESACSNNYIHLVNKGNGRAR